MLELGEEKISFVEVAEELFGDSVFIFECLCAMIVMIELEIAGMDLEVTAGLEKMVVFAENEIFGQLFDE